MLAAYVDLRVTIANGFKTEIPEFLTPGDTGQPRGVNGKVNGEKKIALLVSYSERPFIGNFKSLGMLQKSSSSYKMEKLFTNFMDTDFHPSSKSNIKKYDGGTENII
ncbi:hypothetical protein TREES_T100016777 [Tupaia chinensis]|uniref:Uncharacterized protein n=1 Tax=Tupaia chinensis TaxID=246437 RepID=L9L3S4_TUPCH|nr:hypothetical protein TREES_T100016777 [Tupaia chinensis]